MITKIRRLNNPILLFLVILFFTFFIHTYTVYSEEHTLTPRTTTDSPTITITTGTADSTATSSATASLVQIQLKFGTVSGSYTTCTMQANTTYDGIHYLALGDPEIITVSNNAVNVWVITSQLGTTTASAAALGFGLSTKYTFACSGGYGTSAPAKMSVIYLDAAPTDVTATIDTTGLSTSALQTALNTLTGSATAGRCTSTDTTAGYLICLLKENNYLLQNQLNVTTTPANTFDSTMSVVPNTLTSVTTSTIFTTIVYCNNTTNTAATITISDTAGNEYVSTFSIPSHSNVTFWDSAYGLQMAGIKWQAGTASAINCQILGR